MYHVFQIPRSRSLVTDGASVIKETDVCLYVSAYKYIWQSCDIAKESLKKDLLKDYGIMKIHLFSLFAINMLWHCQSFSEGAVCEYLWIPIFFIEGKILNG